MNRYSCCWSPQVGRELSKGLLPAKASQKLPDGRVQVSGAGGGMRVQSASPGQHCRREGVLPVCSPCPLLLPAQDTAGASGIRLVATSGLPGPQQWEMQSSWEDRALPRTLRPVMVTACRGCRKGFPIACPEGDISVRDMHCLHRVRKGSSLLEENYPLDLGPTTHMASEVISIPSLASCRAFYLAINSF